jgi:DNA-binding response OmpR family regulator
MSAPTKRIFEFGRYRLDTGERVLLRDGRPVPLTLKSFDLLLLLVENSRNSGRRLEYLESDA